MKSKTKRIVIMITLLFLLIIVGGTYLFNSYLKNKRNQESTKNPAFIEGAPPHYLFYLEETEINDSSINLYDEQGNKLSNIKVDLIAEDVNLVDTKRIIPQENLTSKPTKLEKISTRLYALYNNTVILLSKISAPKTILTPEDISSKITDIETIGTRNALVLMSEDKRLRYVDLANKNNSVLNIYTKAEIKKLQNIGKYDSYTIKEIKEGSKNVTKIQADKDGIYCIADDVEKTQCLYRYLLSSNISSENVKIVSEDKISNFVKIEDWIYYTTEEDGALYRIFKDGTLKTKVAEDFNTNYMGNSNLSKCVFGYIDTVYYINKDNKLIRLVVKTNELLEVVENIESVSYNYGYIYYTRTDEDGMFVMDANTNESVKFRETKVKDYVILNEDLPN